MSAQATGTMSGRWIWIGNFLCAFFLLLTFFLLRGYTASNKENQLTELSVTQAAQKAGPLLAAWQRQQAERLLALTQDGRYAEQAWLDRQLAATPDWQAVFLTGADGALLNMAGVRLEQDSPGVLNLTKQHGLKENITLFLPPPFRRVAIGVPFTDGAGGTGYIYAALDAKRFASFFKDAADDFAATVTDAEGMVLFSTDGLLVAGREFAGQRGRLMPRGRELFIVHEAAGQAALYQISAIGPFGWSLNIEKPFAGWPVPQSLVYATLFLSAVCFLCSLCLYCKKRAAGREDDEKSVQLRKRMQSIVDIDHKDDKNI